MRRHKAVLAAVVWFLTACGASAGPVQFIARDPATGSFFEVFADLIPPDPIIPPNPITPPSPIHDLTDPTHPLLTTDVNNEAIFSFGMQGRNGETFSFIQQQLDMPLGDSHHTELLFTAQGSMGSSFHVFFDASFQDDSGRHAPFSADPSGVPPSPIFPQGRFSIDYTLQADPPFTVGIFMLNPAGGNSDLARFSVVPEPGSMILFACGMARLFAARFSCRRRGIIEGRHKASQIDSIK